MNIRVVALFFLGAVSLSGEIAAASKTVVTKSVEAGEVSALMAQLNKRGKSGVAWWPECVKWCREQKLSQMVGLQVFTDSTGKEHKLGIGVVPLRDGAEDEKQVAKHKACMSARSVLLMARSNVPCTQTNTVTRTTTGKIVSESTSSSISWSGISNAITVYETEVQDGAKRYLIVVMSE